MLVQSSVVVVLSLVCLVSAQQQQPKPDQTQQYPRIKIGGPLGQLMPNGFQLGQQLGSLVNQLIGQAESNAIPAPNNSPLAQLLPRPLPAAATRAPTRAIPTGGLSRALDATEAVQPNDGFR